MRNVVISVLGSAALIGGTWIQALTITDVHLNVVPQLESATRQSFTEARLDVPVETAGGAVSPDGRLIAFTGNDMGLGVWDVETSERRSLIPLDPERRGYPRYVAWSPDGKRLAFTWVPNPSVAGGAPGAPELRMIAASGGLPSTLLRGLDGEQLQVFDWSPDSREVLLARWHGEPGRQASGELVAVSTVDQALRRIAGLGPVPVGGTVRRAAFSPDGRKVSYDLHDAGTGRRAVLVRAADDELSIADDTADLSLLTWLPDERLLVGRLHGEQTDVVVVTTKAPAGRTVAARDVGRVDALGRAADGRLFLRKQVVTADIYVATVDRMTGRVTTAPTPLARPSGSPVRRAEGAWSPDGSQVAYASGTDVVVQTIATGELRVYPVTIGQLEDLTWRPDALALVAYGTDERRRSGLHQLDLRTGSVAYLGERIGGVFAPDGRGLFVTGRGGGRGSMAINRIDQATGQESRVDWRGRGYPVGISPDGQSFVVFTGPPGRAATLSKADLNGDGRVPLVQGVSGLSNTVDLTADGRYLYFYTSGPDSDVFRVASTGGEPVATGIRLPFVHRLSVNRDGQRIALSSNMTESIVVVWSGLDRLSTVDGR